MPRWRVLSAEGADGDCALKLRALPTAMSTSLGISAFTDRRWRIDFAPNGAVYGRSSIQNLRHTGAINTLPADVATPHQIDADIRSASNGQSNSWPSPRFSTGIRKP